MAIKVQRTGDIAAPTIKLLVLGPPGAGKTLFGKSWPDPLYLSAEGGLLSVRKYNLPFVKIEETAQLDEVILTLRQPPEIREKVLGVPVQTVIVDTIDEISRAFIKERLAAEHKDAMTQPDWGWLADQLRSLTRGLRNIEDIHVIFTCHLKDQSDEDSGRTWATPQLQGAYRDEITQAFDEVLLLKARTVSEAKDGQTVRRIIRTIQTFPDAKHDWVKDRSGTLPMEFELNFENDYERIANRILAGTAPESGISEAAGVNGGPSQQPTQTQADAPAPTQTQTAPAAKKAAAPAKAAQKRAPAAQSAPKPESTPEPAPAEETSVPSGGTPEEPPAQAEQAPAEEPAPGEAPACSECGTVIENPDKLKDFTRLFKRPLCEKCLRTCEYPVDEDHTCGSEIDDLQKVELSGIRWRKRLCSPHFDAMKKAR